MKYPETIENLISCYQKMPGIGRKSAERMALATLKLGKEEISFFSRNLLDTKEKIKKCANCNNFSEEELCIICNNPNRDIRKICIVEDARKILTLEKLNVFDGFYYLIEEMITPAISNEKIDQLVEPLIKKANEKTVEEIIFALRLTIEGETTVAYITKILSDKGIKITRIAQGVPHGADIDYVDSLTLEKAFEERK